MSNFKTVMGRKSSAEDLQKRAEALKTKKDYSDARFWKPTPDKAGNVAAVIRLLPAPDQDEVGKLHGSDLPRDYCTYYSHSFKRGNKWFIENCPTSIGLQCPVCDDNNLQVENGGDAALKRLQKEGRFRKTNNICNIFVLKDDQNKDAEGKVFLWNMPKTVADIVMEAMAPKVVEEGAPGAFDPFSYMEGANLVLKAHEDGGFRKYNGTSFRAPAPFLDGNEAKLEAVFEASHKLAEFLDPAKFKAYEVLKTALANVSKSNSAISDRIAKDDDNDDDDNGAPGPEPEPLPTPTSDESAKDFFKRLNQK